MQPAKFWHLSDNNQQVYCELCPQNCCISLDQTGACGVRKNVGGTLYSLCYGLHAGMSMDPIEKKPLAHFMSSSYTYSIGTAGCNLFCRFCQNHHLSRASTDSPFLQRFSSQQIIDLAKKHGAPSISFTYNEPIINYEFVTETALMAKEQRLTTIVVSNGMISDSARASFFENIDAANIDLKSIDPQFYKQICGGNISSVLETLRYLHQSKTHLEITNLIIPGLNDTPELLHKLCQFVVKELATDVPVHFSAFYPCYKMQDHPITPMKTLQNAFSIAKEYGLTRIHLGNIGLCT